MWEQPGGTGDGDPADSGCHENALWTLDLFSKPRDFHDSSVGKESSYNAGDPGFIPGLGRSAVEGIGYLLQYSWAFLVAQLVKNSPVMRETWVQSPREGKSTHSSILA